MKKGFIVEFGSGQSRADIIKRRGVWKGLRIRNKS